MALESATYIQSLASSNPPAGDPVSQAADHIRLIKSVLLSTFPNLTAAVTPTAIQINQGVVPTGTVLMWYSTAATIPTGYCPCDGGTYSRSDGTGNIVSPNLLNKFVVAAGSTYTQGTGGGSVNVSGSLTVGGTALTVAQLPGLTVNISDTGHNHSVNDPSHAHGNGTGGNNSINVQSGFSYLVSGSGATAAATTGISLNGAYTGITASIPGTAGATHNHSLSGTLTATPPYAALVYMMKL